MKNPKLRAKDKNAPYLEQTRKLLLAAWSEIVNGLIQKAINGEYQQAKLLISLCELNSSDASKAGMEYKQQLCDVLFERLNLDTQDTVALIPRKEK